MVKRIFTAVALMGVLIIATACSQAENFFSSGLSGSEESATDPEEIFSLPFNHPPNQKPPQCTTHREDSSINNRF